MRNAIGLFLPLLLFACAQTGEETNFLLPAAKSTACAILSAEHRSYWNGTNTCLSNNDFKGELQKRIRNYTPIPYTNDSATIPADFNIESFNQPVPARFDIWDSIRALGHKKIQPMGTTCGANQVYDWYGGNCYTLRNLSTTYSTITPSNLFDSLQNNETSMNREHSWPSSWFNAGVLTNNPAAGSYCFNGLSNDTGYLTHRDYRAFSDAHHLLPTQNSINGIRSDNPYGVVLTNDGGFPTANGNKFGIPSTTGIMTGVPGGVTKVFEPADAMKGDIARIYFYMATRYYTEDTCWPTGPTFYATTRANINTWQENVLRAWHTADPVSDGERARNDLIHRIQGNRNPFVDHPEWVEKISDF